jgi:hypothetical protein
MQWLESSGYLGALLTLATFSMTTMLRLRIWRAQIKWYRAP